MRRQAVMNQIWFALVAVAVIYGAYKGTLGDVTDASFQAAKKAVELAIGLIGAMALWLGLVRIGERAGLMELMARGIRPIMVRLFPEVPPDHPAMSAMVMNMAANALGLGNAATPLGIKAMTLLQELNPVKERATHAMCLFLAINTSNVTLLPLGVITIRAAAGAHDPSAVLVPSILATTISTLVAVSAAKLLAKREPGGHGAKSSNAGPSSQKKQLPSTKDAMLRGRSWTVILLSFLLFAAILFQVWKGEVRFATLGNWLIPILMFAFVAYGFAKGVDVYEVAVEGAREGFDVAVKILPFLVIILVAVAMVRSSGAFELMAQLLSPVTTPLGVPPEVLPVAILRPLSGSGAFGLVSEITSRAPDSFAAYLAGTIQGSTETTFYVLAVYFGAVGITRPRYAVVAALAADVAGFLASVLFCRLLY